MWACQTYEIFIRENHLLRRPCAPSVYKGRRSFLFHADISSKVFLYHFYISHFFQYFNIFSLCKSLAVFLFFLFPMEHSVSNWEYGLKTPSLFGIQNFI